VKPVKIIGNGLQRRIEIQVNDDGLYVQLSDEDIWIDDDRARIVRNALLERFPLGQDPTAATEPPAPPVVPAVGNVERCGYQWQGIANSPHVCRVYGPYTEHEWHVCGCGVRS
jgi:hypothetical protein